MHPRDSCNSFSHKHQTFKLNLRKQKMGSGLPNSESQSGFGFQAQLHPGAQML